MNYRLTITAAVAVILASFSLLTVIEGAGWLYAGAGAVVVVAAAGLATRLAPIPAAVAATALVLIAAVPLLTWPSWPVRIAGLALIAIMAASAGSRTVLPALADVGTYLAALLIYLNLVFAGPQSVAWVIPTVKSLRHLSHLASTGYAEHNYAPPVPGIHGLELIAAAGVGIVAILTDVLAVRMRTPAVAGLPLLVLFSVPVATNVKHVGAGLTLAFCLGITGYLALLAADGRERLRLWGRLVTVWQDQPGDEGDHAPDTRALAASGRRIGLAAVGIAVILPLALPGLQEHGLLGKTPVPGHGTALVSPPAPLVQMRSQLFGHSSQAFLTYRTTAPDPSEQYLQVYVLNYNSHQDGWTLANRTPSTAVGTAALRPAPGLAPATDFTSTRTTVTIGKSSGYTGQMNYLPLPYAPLYLTVPGSGWQETNSTLMVYGYRPDASLTYTVLTKTANPTLAQLSTKAPIPASIKDAYGTYTGPDRRQLLRIARQVTAGATTPFTKAEALEGYFTQSGRFNYSLAGPGASTVLQFLTTNRQGFCQQFAFSMAVLARLIGIPSRIAVGYTAGVPIGHHTWKVTTADAHAWPELYFPGAGWLRFEPTPGGPAAQGTATTPIYAAPTTGAAPTSNPPSGSTGVLPVPGTGPHGRAAQIHKPTSELAPSGGEIAGAKSGGFPVGPVVGLIAAILLVAPGLSRLLIRRRRWLTATGDAGRAHAAWRELSSDLVDHGLAGAMSESPRALARRIAGPGDLDESARAAVHRIAAAEERARYARTPASADALKSDVQAVRKAIAHDATAGQRWRARLMPASILGPVLTALRQAPDVFGWLDAAGLRVRRMVGHALQERRAGS
jgi:transglutaminase-like putative cysteine protease